jgi:hypothetical protein
MSCDGTWPKFWIIPSRASLSAGSDIASEGEQNHSFLKKKTITCFEYFMYCILKKIESEYIESSFECA